MIVALGDPIPKTGTGAGIEPALLGKIDARVNDLAARTASRADGWSTREVNIPGGISSAWGLPADSPIVTGNPGMFYRDGHGKRDPYTWAEFMSALSNRVKARQQPIMVRAKYGVGFDLDGGDMPGWSRNNGASSAMLELGHEAEPAVVIPKSLLTAPLNADERRAYKRSLAALIAAGEDRPMSAFSPPIVLAFQHLGLMPADETDFDTYAQRLYEALREFRTLVGKNEPDDPALAEKVLPAERVALELYDHRVARYTALQGAQEAAMARALDLTAIRGLLKSHRSASKPHVAELQRALAERGLETQVGGRRAKQQHFDGIAGKLTVGSLNRFQLRSGLRQTDGRVDPVTAALLGLRPLGNEIFLTPAGPYSPIPAEHRTTAHCERAEASAPTTLIELVREGRTWAAGGHESAYSSGAWKHLLWRETASTRPSVCGATELL
jgi:hypothetical protein